VSVQDGLHPPTLLPAALAMDDAHPADPQAHALPQIIIEEIGHLGRTEGVQIELIRDGHPDRFHIGFSSSLMLCDRI
jgi:hypothetical protein